MATAAMTMASNSRNRPGHEVGGDGLGRLLCQRSDVDLLDVDDAREVAQPIEQNRQIVIAAVDADGDRPLRVRIATFDLGELREREPLQTEVALIDERFDLLDDLLSVARRRKDAAQLLQLQLQPAHFFPELRQLALSRATLLDLLVELRDLRFSRGDLLLDRLHDKVLHGIDDPRGEEYADGQADVPGLCLQIESHGASSADT